MTRPNGTPEMTERAWELLERIQRQLAARRYEGLEYPQQAAPWTRDETSDRRLRRAA